MADRAERAARRAESGPLACERDCRRSRFAGGNGSAEPCSVRGRLRVIYLNPVFDDMLQSSRHLRLAES